MMKMLAVLTFAAVAAAVQPETAASLTPPAGYTALAMDAHIDHKNFFIRCAERGFFYGKYIANHLSDNLHFRSGREMTFRIIATGEHTFKLQNSYRGSRWYYGHYGYINTRENEFELKKKKSSEFIAFVDADNHVFIRAAHSNAWIGNRNGESKITFTRDPRTPLVLESPHH